MLFNYKHIPKEKKKRKKMMVAKTIRCTSLVLLGLLFVMHALRDFSAYAHHGIDNI